MNQQAFGEKTAGMGWFLFVLVLRALSKTESWIPGVYRTKAEASWISAAYRSRAPCRTARSSIPAFRGVIGGSRDYRVILFASDDDISGPEVALMADENGKRKFLGAVQQDGRITLLSAWTHDPAFDSYVETLVDEEDLLPGYRVEDGVIRIHAVVPEHLLSYGSRQVNGGMGPGNPHGEESEMLYYIHQSIVDGVELEVKPRLEIFW
jgi:hypothetical protein